MRRHFSSRDLRRQAALLSAQNARRLIVLLVGAALAQSVSAGDWGAVDIAKERLAPGERKKFTFVGERTFEGSFIDFAVFAARGIRSGPTLCVTSAIHGDEVNSVEIARRAFASVEAKDLSGTLVVLPAINSSGFRTANRYLPDRRDLNRFFPGNPNGSVASILADAVFAGVIKDCSYLIDLHTGSNFRTNVPQIRVDVDEPEALELARSFGVGIIIPGAGPSGSLRREAMRVGVPSIIYEAGPPYIFRESEIARGTEGIRNVMSHLGMISQNEKPPRARMLGKSRWIRVPRGQGGIYLSRVELGDDVEKGQLLATVTDPVTDKVNEIRAEEAGVVVGLALPQVVLSGSGLVHVGALQP
jgi:predicted deacylase